MKQLQQARSRGKGLDLQTKATKKAEAAKKKMEEGGKMKRQAKFTKIKKITLGLNGTECPQCGKKYANNSRLLKHFNQFHRNNKIQKCKKCTYETRSIDTMRKHIMKKHKKIMWNCVNKICACSHFALKNYVQIA